MLGGPLSSYSRRRPGTRFGGKLGLFRRASSGPTVASDGWQMSVEDPTALSFPVELAVNRAGFTTAGAATTYAETMYQTTRVRQAYPNEASWTDNEVALSDYLYSTDSIGGSAEISPKPIAAWVMPHRLVVDGTVHWEMIAFHRDARPNGSGVGQQIACVRVRGNDGANVTAWQTVAATTLSTLCEDAHAPEVYQNDLDVSGLDDGPIWLEAEVYPWIGAAASILSSEDQSGKREFSRRYFLKDATLAATPPLVYVASTGNDTTGVVDTNAATAAATPCLTVAGAWARALAILGTATGSLDGLRVRIVDGVNMGNPAFNIYTQDVAGVVIERAPGTARASAIATVSATFAPKFTDTNATFDEGALIFTDVSLVMGGAFAFSGAAARKLDVQFWNINWDGGGFNHSAGMRSNSHFNLFGVAGTGLTVGNPFGEASSNELRLLRGLTCDLNGTSPAMWVTVGCQFTNSGGPIIPVPSLGMITYNNTGLSPDAADPGVVFNHSSSGADLGPGAIVQNLIEVTRSTDSLSMRISADSNFGNITHLVWHHNTCVGQENYGRVNIAYDEHPTVARFHKLISAKGNLLPQINTKSDIFMTNGARTGNFAFVHGVGCNANFTRDLNASGGAAAFGQTYPGLNSDIAGGDPVYTDYQGVLAAGPTAGAGGGDYTLQVTSPALDLLPAPLLAFDIDGNARGTGTQDPGVYA